MSCIIVLGCYRSGTSAVAGVLHHLGVSMGSNFDPPSHANPTGYFEDLDFKNQFKKDIDDNTEKLLKTLCKTRESLFTSWGVKDPLLCLMGYRFVAILDQLKIEHKVISTVRSVEAIANSLARAMNSPAHGSERWTPLVEYYLTAKQQFLDNYKNTVLEVDFEALKSLKASEVTRIAGFVDRPITEAALDFVEG